MPRSKTRPAPQPQPQPSTTTPVPPPAPVSIPEPAEPEPPAAPRVCTCQARTALHTGDTAVPVRTLPPAAPAPASPAPPKQEQLIAALRRPEGATVAELMAVSGWMSHSVRGFLSGALKRKRGLLVTSAVEERGRVYRLEDGTASAEAVVGAIAAVETGLEGPSGHSGSGDAALDPRADQEPNPIDAPTEMATVEVPEPPHLVRRGRKRKSALATAPDA